MKNITGIVFLQLFLASLGFASQRAVYPTLTRPAALIFQPAGQYGVDYGKHILTYKSSVEFYGDTDFLVSRYADKVTVYDLPSILQEAITISEDVVQSFKMNSSYWPDASLSWLNHSFGIVYSGLVADMAIHPRKNLLALCKESYKPAEDDVHLYKVSLSDRAILNVASTRLGGSIFKNNRVVRESPKSIGFNRNGNKLIVNTESKQASFLERDAHLYTDQSVHDKGQAYVLNINSISDADIYLDALVQGVVEETSNGGGREFLIDMQSIQAIKRPAHNTEYDIFDNLIPFQHIRPVVYDSLFSMNKKKNLLVSNLSDDLFGLIEVRDDGNFRKKRLIKKHRNNNHAQCIRGRTPRYHTRSSDEGSVERSNAQIVPPDYAQLTPSGDFLIFYPHPMNQKSSELKVWRLGEACHKVIIEEAIEDRKPDNVDWYAENNGRPVMIAMHPSENRNLLLYSPFYRADANGKYTWPPTPKNFTLYDLDASESRAPSVLASFSFQYPNTSDGFDGAAFHPHKKLIATSVGNNETVLWTWTEETSSAEVVLVITAINTANGYNQEVTFNADGSLLVTSAPYSTHNGKMGKVIEVWNIRPYLAQVADLGSD